MFHQARQKNVHRGAQTGLLFHSLIDALVALLGAKENLDSLRCSQVENCNGFFGFFHWRKFTNNLWIIRTILIKVGF